MWARSPRRGREKVSQRKTWEILTFRVQKKHMDPAEETEK